MHTKLSLGRFIILGTSMIGLFLSVTAFAMTSAQYLPADAELDHSIPSPESVLGWQPGEQRIDHGTLVRYLYTLAEKSDRVSIKVTGYTHEHRPLLQLIISSRENQTKLETLRQTHLQATETKNPDAPLVVWLGYSVHGNEASGSNAAPIVAWYLAASRSEYVKKLLANTIIIIDPSLNPDGLNRFASWSNANRSRNPVADRDGRIHNEDWPNGRTNHYLFDLNRDWLPLVHPESRARITEFHRWLPQVITDHHETGYDGFFFQPGVPTRQHPLTTQSNLDMTRALARYHARSLDDAGVMYFTEDAYDDFYYGKGSTYPDINGGIGILFEQPRVNGPLINRKSGPLTFAQAIHNHVRTSLSTLKGAWELRQELKNYQYQFFQTMQQRSAKAGFQAWVIGDDDDPARARELLSVFEQHQVQYRALSKEIKADGLVFSPGHAWVIPVKQRQFGVAQAMLETRTDFEDDTFYDVSAWSLPLAYNLPYARLARVPATTQDSKPARSHELATDAVAWIIPWRQLQAPALLEDLLEAGARVRVGTRPFGTGGTSGERKFREGSLVILAGIQDEDKSAEIFATLQEASVHGVAVHSSNTHLSESGPDLGTIHFKPVVRIKPLLVSGEGTRAYDVGEAWHQLDQRLGLAPVLVSLTRLSKIRLQDYTHLLMVDGNYASMNDDLKKRIVAWVRTGGILVTTQGAATWAESLCLTTGDCDKTQEEDLNESGEVEPMSYADFDNEKARLTIGGAIVSTRLDPTHPIAFGYREKLPLFRRGTTLLKASENPFATPVRYSSSPLISGYIGPERLAEMSNQPAVIAERHGAGLLVRFANNPLFRGFWRGTERLWVNALYFGSLVEKTNLPE